MAASLSGVFNLQEFTDLGLLGAGMRLYTYAPATTTQKIAYTDQAGTIPHTYTADGLGGQYIALNSRGELPAPLFLTTGGYDIALKTSIGVTVWTRRAIGTDDTAVTGLAALTSGLAAGNGGSLVGWLRDLSTAVQTTVYKLLGWRNVTAFEFLSSAQVDDVQDYTIGLNVQTATQNALDKAWGANLDCNLPAGAYSVTGLTQPGNSTFRTRAFRMSGQGSGEIFARGYTGGTILHSTTNAPILQYIPDIVPTGGGNITVDHIRFEGDSTTPVVDLQSFFAQSTFNYNAIHQNGVGDGFRSGWSNTPEIHNNYSINRDWLGTPSLGAARVGAAFRVVQAAEAALTTLRKNTARGFRHGFVLGDSLVGAYSNKVEDFECSYTYNGVLVQPMQRKAQVIGGYMEGIDGGSAVIDQGDYTNVYRTLMFPGWTVGLDSSTTTTSGAGFRDNVISHGSVPNSVGMKLGGTGKVASGNMFLFSGTGGSIAGVVGIELTGVDPIYNWHDNYFPNSWTGGAGTKKINNLTTSGDGTTGYGYIGMGLVENKDKTATFPALSRGAINLKVEPTALTNTDVSAGVLTLGELSEFNMIPTADVAITSFAAPNLPDKTFSIHVRGTAFAVTFTQGTGIKLAGSTNLVTGAAGAYITFQIKPNGVAWEKSRTIF